MGFHNKKHSSKEHPPWPPSACSAVCFFDHTFIYSVYTGTAARFDHTAKSPMYISLPKKHSCLYEYECVNV